MRDKEKPADSSAIRADIEDLHQMTVGQLRLKYIEVFGEESRSNHKQFLFRRIAWRIQANAWGGLSERARRRALEIANGADQRIPAPKNFLREARDEQRTVDSLVSPATDPRLPARGTHQVRRFRGRYVVVHVRENGFECNATVLASPSAVVRAAAGNWWNGFYFFELGDKPGRHAS